MSGLQAVVVDDEIQIRRFLRISLEANGYTVYEVDNGQEALTEIAVHRPDLVILDLGLPDMDGIEVIRRLREWTQTPIVVLSVRDSDEDKIAALDAGADDYLTKPFSVGELLARLRVAQRHTRPESDSSIFQTDGVRVDLTRRLVTVHGEEIKLTPTEYALLRLLIQNVGKALTHRQILREVWGTEYSEETHYLRVYIAQLRQKLEPDPARPQIILTEPGVGYRLVMVEAEV
ncbi:MAG TPA: response regulator [Phototrophicaceae bacterium]|nr:response regulator [Phototrophicaceae bacterium]